jgi:hypothetical protein
VGAIIGIDFGSMASGTQPQFADYIENAMRMNKMGQPGVKWRRRK